MFRIAKNNQTSSELLSSHKSAIRHAKICTSPHTRRSKALLACLQNTGSHFMNYSYFSLWPLRLTVWGFSSHPFFIRYPIYATVSELGKCTLQSVEKGIGAKEGFLFIQRGCVLHLHNMISEEINGTRNTCTGRSANELCRMRKDGIFFTEAIDPQFGRKKVSQERFFL